jgi:IS1 family transposase
MANVLSREKQTLVVKCLVDGMSVRGVERVTGVHRDTILRLMVRVGEGCDRVMDGLFRGLTGDHFEVDELWTFIRKKARHMTPKDDPSEVGDAWTFVAIDADSKLVPCYRVGRRDTATATAFMKDLASRVSGRVQISSDALNAYIDATERAFGTAVDYSQIVKSYEAEPIGPGRYSPPRVVSIDKRRMSGDPDMNRASTSYVERNNLSLRMGLRRFTRLTNAHSKKAANLRGALGLWFGYYNLARQHQTVRCSPAQAAGVARSLWSVEELIGAALAAAPAN